MNSVATVELQCLRSEAGAGVSRAKRGLILMKLRRYIDKTNETITYYKTNLVTTFRYAIGQH